MTMAACWTVKGGQCVLVTAALLLLVFVNTSGKFALLHTYTLAVSSMIINVSLPYVSLVPCVQSLW